MLRTGTLGPSSCFVGDCHLPASQLFLPPRIGGGGHWAQALCEAFAYMASQSIVKI